MKSSRQPLTVEFIEHTTWDGTTMVTAGKKQLHPPDQNHLLGSRLISDVSHGCRTCVVTPVAMYGPRLRKEWACPKKPGARLCPSLISRLGLAPPGALFNYLVDTTRCLLGLPEWCTEARTNASQSDEEREIKLSWIAGAS